MERTAWCAAVSGVHGLQTGRGSLDGVYDFLREELGVRWIFPGDLGEVVPRKSTLTISGNGPFRRAELLYTDLVEVGDSLTAT
ncbi:MAG: hypothetical protein V8T87_06205 [Victivallales bacterium]